MLKKEEIDWVSRWFPIMQKQGEYTNIIFGKSSIANRATGKCEIFKLEHEKYDGIGAFASLLQKEGLDISCLPQMKNPKPPSLFPHLNAITQHLLRDTKIRYVQWKNRDEKKRGKFVEPVWHAFTNQETNKLLAHAKKEHVTINTLLLFHLNKIVQEYFIEGKKDNFWLLPVNMRGGVNRKNALSNHASYIRCTIVPDYTLQEIQADVLTSFKKNYHWGCWWAVNIGKWIGKKGMEKALNKYRNNSHSWVGSLSNIGIWPPTGNSMTDDTDETIWFFTPPSTISHPISTGCITWKGRLSLALQIHPSISEDRDIMNTTISNWREGLLKLIII